MENYIKYEADFKDADKFTPFTVCTKKIYQYENANEYDYALMLTISSLTKPFSKFEKVSTKAITFEALIDAMNIKTGTHKSEIFKRFQTSLQRLVDANIIEVEKKGNRIVISQLLENDEFIQVGMNEYDKMTFIEKNNEKYRAMSTYLSVVERIYPSANAKAMNYVNFESLENIGRKYNVSRQSVSKSIKLLEEMNVFATYKVILNPNSKESKLILSRYDHRAKLTEFVISQRSNNDIKSVLSDSKKDSVEQELHKELQRIAEVLSIETFSKKYINKFSQILKSNDEQSVHNAINYLLSDKYFKDLAFEKDIDKYMNTAFKQFDKFLKKGQAKQVKDDLAQNVLSIDRSSVTIDCDEEDEATTDEWYALVK